MKSKGKPMGKSQRGKQRKFTNFEELQSQAEKIARKKERGDDEEEDEDEEESEEVDSTEDESSEQEESGEDEEEEHKPKGVESLIDIENPNRRRPKKDALPTTAAAGAPTTKIKPENKPELSRREREELEKQRRAMASISLKSEQARSDMARLALIRAQRAEAALKREAAKQQAAAVAAAKK